MMYWVYVYSNLLVKNSNDFKHNVNIFSLWQFEPFGKGVCLKDRDPSTRASDEYHFMKF